MTRPDPHKAVRDRLQAEAMAELNQKIARHSLGSESPYRGYPGRGRQPDRCGQARLGETVDRDLCLVSAAAAGSAASTSATDTDIGLGADRPGWGPDSQASQPVAMERGTQPIAASWRAGTRTAAMPAI
jgi:hypothetical protein